MSSVTNTPLQPEKIPARVETPAKLSAPPSANQNSVSGAHGAVPRAGEPGGNTQHQELGGRARAHTQQARDTAQQALLRRQLADEMEKLKFTRMLKQNAVTQKEFDTVRKDERDSQGRINMIKRALLSYQNKTMATRSWHNDADIPMRTKMIEYIYKRLNACNKDTPPGTAQRAQILESVFYAKSTNRDEYLDPFTLSERIKTELPLVDAIIQGPQALQERKYKRRKTGEGAAQEREYKRRKTGEGAAQEREYKRQKTSEGAAANDDETPVPLDQVLYDTRASAYQFYGEKPEGCEEWGAAVILVTRDGKICMYQGDRVPLKPECAMIDPQNPVKVNGKDLTSFIPNLKQCHETHEKYASYWFPHIMLREKAEGTRHQRLDKLLREELQCKSKATNDPAGYLQRGNSAHCLPLFIMFADQVTPHAEAQRKHEQVQGVFTPKSIIIDGAAANDVDVSNTELFTPEGDHYKLKSDYHEVRNGVFVPVEEVPARLEQYARCVHAARAQHSDFSLEWWGDNAFLQPEIWKRVVNYIEQHASAQ